MPLSALHGTIRSAAEQPKQEETMLPIRTRLMFALICAVQAAPDAMAQAASPPPRIATVNGVAIPKALFDFVLRERTRQGAPNNEQMRRSVVDDLINNQLAVQDAARRGIADDPELKAQIELARETLIYRAFVRDVLKDVTITDEQLRAEFDRLRLLRGDKEYKARHIMLPDEAGAKNIIARLGKGEKFEELAKESADSGSRDRGGDLGWNPPTSYVKTFADALVALEKGKYTRTPVQTEFGWHVIRLDETRPIKSETLEEVRPRLTQRMQQQAVDNALAELRAKAKIE
jgi:peptidyl-prolyl cis-trans isomerase C